MRFTAAACLACILRLAISAFYAQPAGPAIDINRALRDAAALAGEPRTVSAGGITRSDARLVTIENGDPFASAPARRLVVVGGLDGEDTARAALDVVSWFKTRAPRALREQWAISAMPAADPDGRSRHQAFQFPPDKGFFDDPQQPEPRYLWRWLVYQAPDLVLVVSNGGASGASLVSALGSDRAAGLGPAPAVAVAAAEASAQLPKLLADHPGRSRLHDVVAARVTRDPIDIARVLARRYPETPSVSYIPSVAWVNTLRLASIVGDESLRAKVRQQIAPWISGEKKLFGDRIQLTSVAGTMIYADLARDGDTAARALADEGARLASERQATGIASYASGWTDDMFMASAVLARTAVLPQHDRDLDSAARLLIDYASRLQRPDGVFMHATDGPFAWGRGNGFAALGLMEALTALPERHASRAPILEIYRRHMAGLKSMQAPDGMWRQVIDEPGSYREETATAMILSAMSRGIRLGWIDRAYLPVVQSAWRGLAAHVADDGALVDVCTGTGSGPTRRYYLDRAAISGPDDRGGAMALLAAMETYELNRAR
jgi:unsaturated rhamnogalacturonyl hydrolase